MESIISKNQVEVSAKYPRLMAFTEKHDLRLVVLMISDKSGTVMWAAENNIRWLVGDCSDSWDFTDFKDFNGELLLKN